MATFKYILSVFTFAAVSLFLSACSENEIPSESDFSSSPFCSLDDISKTRCEYKVDDITLLLMSDSPAMPVEQPVRLIAISDQPIRMQRAEIIGLSMYMGRIPVAWNAVSDNRWEADIMLGACTERNMLWQLQLRFESKEESHELQLPFYSIRN